MVITQPYPSRTAFSIPCNVLAESGAIVEYICHRYAGGRLTVRPEQPNYADYLYWMYFNNNVLGLFFAKNVLRANAHGPEAERMRRLIERRQEGYYRYLEQRGAAPGDGRPLPQLVPDGGFRSPHGLK